VWRAADRENNLIIYRELVQAKVDAYQLGKMISDIEAKAGEVGITGPLDPQAWDRLGTGVTPADCYHRAGVKWFRAKKGPESRKLGVYEMHRRLSTFTPDGAGNRIPSIRIFENCTNLLSVLSILEPDPNDPEDVLKSDGDDVFEALRYVLRHSPLRSEPVPNKSFRDRFGLARATDGLRGGGNRSPITGY
jgi:hypothetical protein